MKRSIVQLLLCVCVAAILKQCNVSSVPGPGGSEVTNGFVMTTDGLPVSGIEVTAYHVLYLQRNSRENLLIAKTDDRGYFELEIDTGLYNVFVIDTAGKIGICVRDVGPGEEMNVLLLDSLGAISGIVHDADSGMLWSPLYIYSLGSPFGVFLYPDTRSFTIDNVPPGSYSLSMARVPFIGCPSGSDCQTPPGESSFSNVAVTRGDTVVVDTTIRIRDVGYLQ